MSFLRSLIFSRGWGNLNRTIPFSRASRIFIRLVLLQYCNTSKIFPLNFLSASDHLFLDLFAESSMNLRKLIDLDRELVSNFSEFHGWALNDDAFGFDDLG